MSAASITESLADWIVGAKFEDLPRRIIEEAKSQTLSTIAAVHAGHFSEVGRNVRRTVQDWGGGKDAPAQQDMARRRRPSFDVAPWASIEGGGLQAFGRF